MNIDKLVRENIRNLSPYSSARDEYQESEGIFLDANENPFGTNNRYPDPLQKELKQKISEIKNIDINNIFLGNGSDEAIDLIYRIFCNPKQDKVLTFNPTYGMYKVSSEINEVELTEIPLTNNFHIDLQKIESYLFNTIYKVFFICSPNNPTSNSFKTKDIEYILTNFHGIVVIDEAYIDFSKEKSFINKINDYPNLIVMQTFSKAFAMANVRIGMAFSNPEIIKYFNKVKSPYNISGINQKTLLDRLKNVNKVDLEIKEILKQRSYLVHELNKLEIVLKIYPSDSNFILVKFKDANKTYDYLTNNQIITRNRNNIIKNCIRITIGTSEQNKKLIQKLQEF